MTLVVGLTGGIASGKSTVVDYFRQHAFPIVDGDQIARKIVQKGQPALEQVFAHFGSTFATTEGELDRKKLGAYIFQHPEARKQLDQLLDPYLRSAIGNEIALAKTQQVPMVIVDLPLLFEAHYDTEMDTILVVNVTAEVQVARLMKRNNFTRKEALERIASQMALEEKVNRADIVFDNNGTIEQTQRQVKQWLETLSFH